VEEPSWTREENEKRPFAVKLPRGRSLKRLKRPTTTKGEKKKDEPQKKPARAPTQQTSSGGSGGEEISSD